MSLKNEIEKEMFNESIEDRFQDIASLIDSPVEDVQKRMKTLSFSDYIKVMSALKSKDESTIKSMMGLSEGWSELPAMPDKYIARDGLEGPIMTKSGKVVYYDPKEGSYYDPDTDMYIDYETWKMLDSENMHKIDMEVPEAYSTGSQGPDDEQQAQPSAMDTKAANQKLKTQRTQAMQRLGTDNLGGATAQMAANAIDNAQQGKVLTPMQRQALAHQAQNLDDLAINPDTRMQFRNLLNKLNREQE
tara:strand:+ start:1679 stop:2416 length:738 start_codon:yes stop_codon:yes gene_type:complete